MTTNWVPFSATVPDWALPALTRHVADFAAQAAANERAAHESEEERVRRTLGMIKTPDGWTLIKVMADLSAKSPNGWADWSAMCDEMGMEPRKLSGVLGGIEKSTKDVPPLYERSKVADKPRFRMKREVIKIVFTVVRERTGEALDSRDSDLFE